MTPDNAMQRTPLVVTPQVSFSNRRAGWAPPLIANARQRTPRQAECTSMRGYLIPVILLFGGLPVSATQSAPPAQPAELLPLSRVVDYEPAWSPDGSNIVFVSNRNGYFKVYSMRADGTELKQLTQGLEEDDAPAWSPDGSRIAYVSTRDGNQEIFVMRPDGSGMTNLTHHPAFDGWPSWSRDGKRVVFAREHGDEASIYVMNADGSAVTAVVDVPGRCTNPRWSPVGDLIVFSRRAERQIRLYVLEMHRE
jgi:dipeptidyl aminopeptidase/acylaminoacyl peptidase